MEVFRNTIATITYDAKNARLFQKWSGFPKSDAFRNAIDITVEFSGTHKVETILSNTVDQGIINRVDADYAARIMPTLEKNGLKAFAFLVSGKVYSQFAIDHFSSEEETKLVKYFPDYQKAIEWLDKISL